MRNFISILFLSAALAAGAQGWVYSPEFGTDFWTSNPSSHPDDQFVDCNKGTRNIQSVAKCMREDGANSFSNPTILVGKEINTNGLYNKVSRKVTRAPKKRSTSTSTAPTSAKQARKTGKNYNHQTSEAGRAWRAKKREAQLQAQREAAERKRRQELERKIADDNRAAEVTAMTNAMLQQQTNRRIASDYYHANEGAAMAQQRARQAHKLAGPQFDKNAPKSTGRDKARMLRGQNKPRRIMKYPQTQRRNTARPQLAQVQRRPLPQERAAMLKKALMVRAELRRIKKAEQTYAEYKGIKLDDGAVSTLGKDWSSETLTTPPAPSPTRSVMTADERQQMILKDYLDSQPMSAEEYREIYYSEMLGDQ